MALPESFCIIINMNFSDAIKQQALDLGFDAVSITDASPVDVRQVEFLGDWLKAGFAGQMSYMHRNFEKRINPAALLDGARSVVVVALSYKPREGLTGETHSEEPTGRIAHYGRYEDYHVFIKNLLRKLAGFIDSIVNEPARFKLCVDSAPLAERALAQRAGLGFIGKNHMLISPRLGPEILLGELITTVQLQPDEPVQQSCKLCDKCIEACPTGALRADGQFDAAKCINYLTIEYAGDIRADLAKKIDDRLFGCDRCILACPYYSNAPACSNNDFKYYTEREYLNLNSILKMTEDDFDREFGNSPIHRTGLATLKRNARICLNNVADKPDTTA